jgi:hypothetical protein
MLYLLHMINHATGNVPLVINMLYLLFQRPVYCIGISFTMMPFILDNSFFTPITNAMRSEMWYPLARLSYGAYLSHSIFMIFKAYNTEKGLWASESDTFLFFFAYLGFAFLFSLVMTVLIETPCRKLYDEYVIRLRGDLKSRVSASIKSFTSSDSKKSISSSEDLSNLLYADSTENDSLEGLFLNEDSANYLPKVSAQAIF